MGVSQRLLLSITARESKKRERTKQKKKRKNTFCLVFPLPYSSISSGAGSDPRSTSASPEPSWATGVSTSGDLSSGDSTAPSALLALRSGGGDLYPLAAKRASLLVAQASAHAP